MRAVALRGLLAARGRGDGVRRARSSPPPAARVPEVVGRDDETGLLVPPGDPDALAAALRGPRATPSCARRIGAAGRDPCARAVHLARRPRTAPSSSTARSSRSAPRPGRGLMLTVDFDRLGVRDGHRVLDMGCGGGRHAYEAMRRGATVVALDCDAAGAQGACGHVVRAMIEAGELAARTRRAARSTATRSRLPFPDATFDRIIASEVLEHVWADDRAHRRARAGAAPGRPAGRDRADPLARAGLLGARPRVPRHARRPRAHLPPARARSRSSSRRACTLRGSHHAHALHSPYWWLKCAVGVDNADALAGAQVPRLPRVADHATARVARARRPRAQPGPRQEPRGLHREGRPDAAAATCSPRSPASITAAQVAETVDAIAGDPAARRQHPVDARAATPTRGTSSKRRWPSTSAAATPRPSARTSGCARMQRPDGAWHAYYRRQRDQGPHPRHQRHLLRRQRRVAPLPLHRRHRVPRGVWPMVEPAIDYALDVPARDGRDRVARRRPRRRRAAHRFVEHAREPAVRDRHRRTARSRAARLGALARHARHRGRAPTRRVPRQGPLGDGLVLPDPRRRAARPRRRTRASRPAGSTFVVDGRGVRCVVGPAVGHRGGDVRVRDGARRHRRPTSTPGRSSRGCSSCAPTAAATGPAPTSRTSASTSTASSTPSSSPPGTRPRSCSRRTRSAARARPPGCSAARTSPGLTPDELLAAGVEIERERAAHAAGIAEAEHHRPADDGGRPSDAASTRRLPVVDDGLEAARRRRAATPRTGACPPSAGSSNTSWNTSSPPGDDEAGPAVVVGQRDVEARVLRRRTPARAACAQWRRPSAMARSPRPPTSSRPASSMVRRKNGRVSIRPVRGSTRRGSWCSHPAWFSSEPRWWSTV